MAKNRNHTLPAHNQVASQQKRPRQASFQSVMKKATRSMPRAQQLLSRFIHIDSVYFVSGFIGAIIARPNAILFGAIASFVFTLVTYLLAKNLGYSLSGFESIGAFIVGWLAGMAFDFVTFLTKRKQ